MEARLGILNTLWLKIFFVCDGLTGMDHHCKLKRSCAQISVFVFWLRCFCLSRANSVWVSHASQTFSFVLKPVLPITSSFIYIKSSRKDGHELPCHSERTHEIDRDSWRGVHMDRLLVKFGGKLWEASFSNNTYQGKTTIQPQMEYEI